MTKRLKPPRWMRRLLPVVPQGEMAREAFDRAVTEELDQGGLPGLDSPLIRHINTELHQLSGSPIEDALEGPDFDDDWDPSDYEEP